MAKAGRIFFPLDVNWYEDWGHLVSDDAALLWTVTSCACKRMLKDGRLTIAQLRRAAPASLVESQVRFANAVAELCNHKDAPVERDGDSAIIFRGWASWNDLAADIEAMSEGGKHGAHLRWHVKKKKPSSECVFCVADGLVGVGHMAPQSPPQCKSRVDTDTDTDISLASLATPKPRKRDELFEALVEVCGKDLKNLPRTERGRLNAATKELRESNATPDEVRQRALMYHSKWPGADLTPQALTGNWSSLAVKPKPAFSAGTTSYR